MLGRLDYRDRGARAPASGAPASGAPRAGARATARGRLPQPAPAHVRAAAGAEEGAHRPLEPRLARPGHPRPTDRLGGGAAPLVRPLAQGRGQRRRGRASGHLLRAGLRRAPGRPAGDERLLARGPRLPARPARPSRCCTSRPRAPSSGRARPACDRARGLDPQAAARPSTTLTTYRPTVGIAGRALERRRALRAPDRPATGRAARPDLHHRAARRRRSRSSAGRGPCSTSARRRR